MEMNDHLLKKSRLRSRRYFVHSQSKSRPKKSVSSDRSHPHSSQSIGLSQMFIQPVRLPQTNSSQQIRSSDLKPAGRGRKWLRELAEFKKQMSGVVGHMSTLELSRPAEQKLEKINELLGSLSIESGITAHAANAANVANAAHATNVANAAAANRNSTSRLNRATSLKHSRKSRYSSGPRQNNKLELLAEELIYLLIPLITILSHIAASRGTYTKQPSKSEKSKLATRLTRMESKFSTTNRKYAVDSIGTAHDTARLELGQILNNALEANVLQINNDGQSRPQLHPEFQSVDENTSGSLHNLDLLVPIYQQHQQHGSYEIGPIADRYRHINAGHRLNHIVNDMRNAVSTAITHLTQSQDEPMVTPLARTGATTWEPVEDSYQESWSTTPGDGGWGNW